MEQWKVLKELDKYSISNYGRIKNNKTGKIKALGIHNGYYFISFEDYKNGKRLPIHQLVAKYFIPNIDNLKCINHKDCMNAMMVVNALKGSEKAYELVAKMIHESPEDSPKQVQNNLFVLPDKVELDSIASILSDDKHKIDYDDIAGMKGE